MNRLRKLQYAFEADPKFQIKFNKFFTYFWIANFIAVPLVYTFANSLWNKFSVLYLVLASLYANVATNYSGLSASEASEAATHVKESL